MRHAINFAYRSLRGRQLSEDIEIRTLVGFSLRKLIEGLRGLILGRGYTSSLIHFRGRSVKITARNHLTVGSKCAFSDNVLIEANSVHGVRMGNGVTIARSAHIAGSGVIAAPGYGVHIGDRTAIGTSNVIWGQGGVTIGSDCLFGPNVVVVSENHNFDSVDLLIREQGETRAKISIGDNCWIGASSVIVAGVSIGSGCVIGAGSVVTRDLLPNSVAVGVPAKVVRTR